MTTTKKLPQNFKQVWEHANHKTVQGLRDAVQLKALGLESTECMEVLSYLEGMAPAKTHPTRPGWRTRTFVTPFGEHVFIDAYTSDMVQMAHSLGLVVSSRPALRWEPVQFHRSFYNFKQHADGTMLVTLDMDSGGELRANVHYPCIYLSRVITASNYTTALRELFTELAKKLQELTPELEAYNILQDSPRTVALVHYTCDDLESELASSGSFETYGQVQDALRRMKDLTQERLDDAVWELKAETVNVIVGES